MRRSSNLIQVIEKELIVVITRARSEHTRKVDKVQPES